MYKKIHIDWLDSYMDCKDCGHHTLCRYHYEWFEADLLKTEALKKARAELQCLADDCNCG